MRDTIEWKNYESLINFDPNIYFDDLKNEFKKYDKNFLFYVFNYFNNLMEIKFKIDNDNDLIIYLNRSKKLFNKIAESYRRKMIKILDDSRYTGIYIHDDFNYVVKYEDYTKRSRSENLDILLEIDYKEFFKRDS